MMYPWSRKALLVLGLLSVSVLAFANAEMEVKQVAGTACMDCHGSTPKFAILGARMTYDTSGHKQNGNSVYANGGGCQQCHTSEGFIAFVATGKIDTQGFVDYPSQPGCATCHAPHETGDLSLRTVKAVTLANKEVFDVGNGNLCANCHMARSDAKAVVKASPANTITARFGPHHGPQADMIMGTNAFEDPRKSYSSSPHSAVVSDGCVVCHMSLPDGRYAFSPEIGGHSFNIGGEVHEAELLNKSGCVACHTGITQAVGASAWTKAGGAGVIWIDKSAVFKIIAKDDYDLDGAKEPVQDEVQGLMDRLVNQAGTGVLQRLNPPFYNAAGAFLGTQSTAVRPVEQVAALYNYMFVLEDRSRGVHNAVYTIEILYDSISALDASFNTSRRP